MASFVIRSAVPARDALFWLTCRLPARGSARTVGARVPDKRRFPCCGSRGGRRHHPHPGRGAGARHGSPPRALARRPCMAPSGLPEAPLFRSPVSRLSPPAVDCRFPCDDGHFRGIVVGWLSPRAAMCRPVGCQDSCQPISACAAERRSNTNSFTLSIEAECAPSPRFGAPAPAASRRVPPRSV